MGLLILLIAILAFILYLLVDFLKADNVNAFMDNWLRRTLFIWLPFYALWRLTKEVIFKKN
jgi:hypothetical protein